jgi:predicted transcriptional regulator
MFPRCGFPNARDNMSPHPVFLANPDNDVERPSAGTGSLTNQALTPQLAYWRAPRKDQMSTDIAQNMLNLLTQRGPMKANALIALARTTHATGHRYLARLVEQGLVEKAREKGLYRLPTAANPEERWVYAYLRSKWTEAHTARTVAQAFREAHTYRWPEQLVAQILMDAETAGLLSMLSRDRGNPMYTVNRKAPPQSLADLLS